MTERSRVFADIQVICRYPPYRQIQHIEQIDQYKKNHCRYIGTISSENISDSYIGRPLMYRTKKDRTEAWVLFQKRPKD